MREETGEGHRRRWSTVRLRGYFHRGRHRPAAGRTPVRNLIARRGHIAGTLPDGSTLTLSGLYIERVTDVSDHWQFLDRDQLTTK